MATIMNKNGVTASELVTIGDWSTEEMARKYIERLNLFALDARNYSDVALKTAAARLRAEQTMQPRQKKHAARSRQP